MLGSAHDDLIVLVQQQEAGVSTVGVNVEGEVVSATDWGGEDS